MVQEPLPAAGPREASGSVERRGSPPPPLYKPTLWGAHVLNQREGRPKQERDSLRSRSKEGRPGSRKHRRYTHSMELVGSLRRAMARCGEPSDHVSGDPDSINVEVTRDWRPSAFYQLLEYEGPNGALDAWAAAENARRPASRPHVSRTKDPVKIAEENQRAVRRALGDSWQFVRESGSMQDFIQQLEQATARAFGAAESKDGLSPEEQAVALSWLLAWDGESFETKSGAPPTIEMAVLGLAPGHRKVVHQLAQLLGLRSASRLLDEGRGEVGDKVLTIRPPRSRCGAAGAWEAPFSVSQVLATA